MARGDGKWWENTLFCIFCIHGLYFRDNLEVIFFWSRICDSAQNYKLILQSYQGENSSDSIVYHTLVNLNFWHSYLNTEIILKDCRSLKWYCWNDRLLIYGMTGYLFWNDCYLFLYGYLFNSQLLIWRPVTYLRTGYLFKWPVPYLRTGSLFKWPVTYLNDRLLIWGPVPYLRTGYFFNIF